MDRIPPELWDQIFRTLRESVDFENCHNASPIWRNFLHDSKSSWMFGQAFPVLIPYLSKSDIFQCRKICKLWCYGVDSYMENNPYHKPTCEIWPSSNYRTNFHPKAVANMIQNKNLAYCCCPGDYRKSVAAHNKITAVPHRNPIVGRSALITEPLSTPIEIQRNTEYLYVYGRYIHFLKICIDHETPLVTLRRITHLLRHVPNLTKLEIEGNLVDPRVPLEILRHTQSTNSQAALRQMTNFLTYHYTPEEKENLPRLETLELRISGICNVELSEILVDLLSSKKLTSFSIDLAPSLPPKLETSRLVNLSLILNDPEAFNQLRCLRSPLRTLELTLKFHVNADTLFATLTEFRDTICCISLNLQEEYFQPGKASHISSLTFQLDSFWNRNVLGGFKNLKRFTLEGYCPPSLNFIFGLRHHLEYLHIHLKHTSEWESFLQSMIYINEFPEEGIDLLEYLKRTDSSTMYESNLWKVFPKLRELESKRFQEDSKLQVYRRDIYEKQEHQRF